MAWSFRKRIKLIPGVHLNLSKSGISTSIGFRGASMTFGNSGTYLNLGIPGTGIQNRQKLGSQGNQTYPIPSNYDYISVLPENIFSADLHEITSQDMEGVKQAIFTARHERADLKNDISNMHSVIFKTKFKRFISYLLIYGLLNKKVVEKINVDLENQKQTLKGLGECLENCFVNIDVGFDDEIKTRYNAIVATFNDLTTSHKIWDVTSAYAQNTVVTRSSASTVIQKKDVRFSLKNLPEVKTAYPALHFQNANGADIYFYPTFVIMYRDKDNFAIVSYKELDMFFEQTRFLEEGQKPNDSTIIDWTWKKVNKNGTPDKRFKDNYKIPVVRYGTVKLNSKTGIREEYMFSNFEKSAAFANAFSNYKSIFDMHVN